MQSKTKKPTNYFYLHPKIYKQVRDIAKTLPNYKKAVEVYESEGRAYIDNMQDTSMEKTDDYENGLHNYLINKNYVDKIEKTFITNIRPQDREKVNKMFYGKNQDRYTIDFYDEPYIKDEVNKWLYFLACELGINTLDKKDL